jgi:hypothetical protein
MTSRDIAVSELRVQHDALFRPPAVQRLVGLEPLVAGQCFAFVGFDQRGVQGRYRHLSVRLEKSEQRLVDLPQGADRLSHRRDDRAAGRARLTGCGVMKPGQPHRRGRRHGAPPRRASAALGGRRAAAAYAQPRASPGQSRRPAPTAPNPPAARQVQHDQRHDHLKIEPALLPGDPDMLADRDIQPLIRSR